MAPLGQFKANLPDLARHLLEKGPRKVHPTSRRVRVLLNHTLIVDTTKAVHVWEHDGYPQFYVPLEALQHCSFEDKQVIDNDAAVVQITIPARAGLETFVTDRAIRFGGGQGISRDPAKELSGLLRLEFKSMDQWFEEDTPIYVHPKDPFKRVDVLSSSRRIEVKVKGAAVAKSASILHLLETGLPTRYYLPLTDVDPSVLRKSQLVTQCPYKGDAEYYHVVVDGEEIQDLVWYYRLPTLEVAAIAGRVCFYNEKVDIYLDGELQERPKTVFG